MHVKFLQVDHSQRKAWKKGYTQTNFILHLCEMNNQTLKVGVMQRTVESWN